MKFLIIAIVLTSQLFASTILSEKGDIYSGTEYYNHTKTGKTCHVVMRDIEPIPSRLHCYNLTTEFIFPTKNKKIKNSTMLIKPSVTKNDNGLKTCASRINPRDPLEIIYNDESDGLFNPLFSNTSGGFWSGEYHYFLLYSTTKHPKEAKIHYVGFVEENDWTCSDLKLK